MGALDAESAADVVIPARLLGDAGIPQVNLLLESQGSGRRSEREG